MEEQKRNAVVAVPTEGEIKFKKNPRMEHRK